MSLSVTPTPCVNFAAQVLNQHRQTLFKKSAHLVYVNMLCSHVNIHKLKLIFMFWVFFITGGLTLLALLSLITDAFRVGNFVGYHKCVSPVLGVYPVVHALHTVSQVRVCGERPGRRVSLCVQMVHM